MAEIKEQVDTVFRRLAAEELTEAAGSELSGWEMTLPSGRRVVRSELQAHAQPLVALGPDAIPELLPWVMEENPALRYVAVYALEQLTGERPHVPHFARGDEEGHRARALEVWRGWLEKRGR